MPTPAFVEPVYSRGIYPFLASVFVSLGSGLPFSLSSLLLILLPILWITWMVVSFRRWSIWRWLFVWLWRGVVAAVFLGLWFTLSWGTNYKRASVEAQLGLSDGATTEADLERFSELLLALIEQNVSAPRDEKRAMASLKTSLQNVVQDLTGVMPPLPETVKRLPGGSLIRFGNASGVMSPFTLEPHVDGALPEVSFLAVGAHELAHVAGYAGEADADFIAALAGLRADDAYARYAVSLRLFNQATAQLPAKKRSDFLEALPPRARQDLEDIYEPFRRYQMSATLRRLQQKSYDSYLKRAGVEEGIADYSRSIWLLLQAQKEGHLAEDVKED